MLEWFIGRNADPGTRKMPKAREIPKFVLITALLFIAYAIAWVLIKHTKGG